MDFGGGPLWDGAALVDILPFEHELRRREESVESHFPAKVVLYGFRGVLLEKLFSSLVGLALE